MTTKPRNEFPTTRVEAVTDEIAGVSFPDPYRWLEANTPEVHQWQREQSRLTAAHVRRWPHYDALKRSVEYYRIARPLETPRYAAGSWFRLVTPEGASHSVIVVSPSMHGEGRTLFDPMSESAASPPFVSWLAPSPDGRILALGLCTDGSEKNSLRLIDVASGTSMPDVPRQVLMDAWCGGTQWTPDSSAFYFTALKGDSDQFELAVYFHRVGEKPSGQPEPIQFPTGSQDYCAVTVSRDGRWAVALHGVVDAKPIAVRDLATAAGAWRPFLTRTRGTVTGAVFGNRYVAVTDVGAPRGRVVAIPLDSVDPDDVGSWEELVPESAAAMRSLTRVGDRFFIHELVATYSRVRIFGQDGSPAGDVPLPGLGAVVELPFPLMTALPKAHPDDYVFGFSTLTQSFGTYRYRGSDHPFETIIEPKIRFSGTVVEECWATSADGTKIPYHKVRRKDLDPTRPQPTLIYAYGAFNAPLFAQYPGAMAAFIAAGGIFVQAHLRGGGEFGLEWWRAGSKRNKQNSYDDLFSIAADLVTAGVTTHSSLAVTGGSAGGLMAAIALTQRPELWKAVVPRVPVCDLIGACRYPYGMYANRTDFADPDTAEEVRRLSGISPYHLVEDGVSYPAMLIDAGDTDLRCPPWHARKFTARVQAAQGGAAPILLHVWENAGHGWATADNIQVEQNTGWLAFVMQELGMVPQDPQ